MSKGAQLVLAASSRKKIGVFATEFTINSGAHKAAILAADDGADVYPQACPKFVPLIEGEQFDGAEVRAAVAEYAAPLKAAGIDTLILSCNALSFIQKEIESEFGSEVTVIDRRTLPRRIRRRFWLQRGFCALKEQVLWRSALPPMWNAARGSPAECCRRGNAFLKK